MRWHDKAVESMPLTLSPYEALEQVLDVPSRETRGGYSGKWTYGPIGLKGNKHAKVVNAFLDAFKQARVR